MNDDYSTTTITSTTYTTPSLMLIDRSDRRLFYCTRQSHHCLNPLLPPPSPASQTYNLRRRGNAYSLPTVKSTSFM